MSALFAARWFVVCCLVPVAFARLFNPLFGSLKARVDIRGVGKNQNVKGSLKFVQTTSNSPVLIQGYIEGLAPGSHGIHIHEKGTTGDDCKASGPHFNPFQILHGAPSDVKRHVGDLGNIESSSGNPPKSNVYIIDDIISLTGERSIMNRAVVIHAGKDDLGRGNNEESKKAGNSGERVACGVVLPSTF